MTDARSSKHPMGPGVAPSGRGPSRVACLALAICLCAPLLGLGARDARAQAATGASAVEAADAVAERNAEATSVVESLHDVLLESMKRSDELGFQQRYELVVGNLDQTFDLEFMARTSIGKTWKGLDEAQRIAWVNLSRRLSASTYASNFKGYSGQSFTTFGVDPAAHNTLVVHTELVQPADKNVKFDYRLRRTNDGWRIIDIQLDGKVSEITVRRADYRSVIERRGFEQLEADLNEKIEKLAAE